MDRGLTIKEISAKEIDITCKYAEIIKNRNEFPDGKSRRRERRYKERRMKCRVKQMIITKKDETVI